MLRFEDLPEHFRARVEKTDGCWLWHGRLDKWGYGRIKIKGKQYLPHRFLFQNCVAYIPYWMYVCHWCDVPNCVRPEHLFMGTPRDNTWDMECKGRGRHLTGPNYNRANKKRGEQHNNAKLTDSLVREIRFGKYKGWSRIDVAREIGVSPPLISYVLNNKIWKHVKETI